MTILAPSAYLQFLAAKRPAPTASGLTDIPALHPALFPHQRDCVEFGLLQGRWLCAISTGLGKTFIQLEWSRHAAAATNGVALILTPLAVAAQIAAEGQARGYDCRVIRDQSEAAPGINICNYDRLDRLDPDAFGAVSLDEASILKNFNGKTRQRPPSATSPARSRRPRMTRCEAATRRCGGLLGRRWGRT